MEDSSTTSGTLAVYRELRGQGLDNIGIVLQARLRRTLDDARSLADLRPDVRLCKGIYVDGGRRLQDDGEVGGLVRIAEVLAGARGRVAFATQRTG